MSRFVKLGLMLFVSFTLVGCASTKATRIDASKTTDLSGNWNDSDARMVAEEMINDCLQGQWLWDFNKAKGRAPVVIVGSIRNKTSEHIASDVFIDTLQRSLINSGKVEFVASPEEREELRGERQDQLSGNTEPSTATPTGHEVGADFVLQGNINAIQDTVESQSMVVGRRQSTQFYQVSLELIDLRTNQKRWIGQKSLKKFVSKKKVF